LQVIKHCVRTQLARLKGRQDCPHTPVQAFPPSIFIDKNRRDIGKSQSKWTASKMETPGARRTLSGGHVNRAAMDKDKDHILLHGADGSEQLLLGAH
jgi:hypothetical protein